MHGGHELTISHQRDKDQGKQKECHASAEHRHHRCHLSRSPQLLLHRGRVLIGLHREFVAAGIGIGRVAAVGRDQHHIRPVSAVECARVHAGAIETDEIVRVIVDRQLDRARRRLTVWIDQSKVDVLTGSAASVREIARRHINQLDIS